MGSRFGIRSLIWMSSGVLLVVTAVSVMFLLGIIAVLERSIDVVSRDTRSAAIADDLEVAVLMYQRMSNVFRVTGAADAAASRQELSAEIQRMLVQLPEHGGGELESQLIVRLATDLPQYLGQRNALDARGANLEEVLRASGAALNQVLSTLGELKAVNDGQVLAATDTAHQANRLAMYFAGGTLLLLVGGACALAWRTQRELLRPVLDMHEVMAAFRRGDRAARSSARGASEVAELSRIFNDMADSMEQQRRAQLEFLGGVAHDFKNPLSTLKNGVHLLAMESSDGQRARIRALLDGQIDLLVRMVDDFLDGARIEAGELELRLLEFDARHLARDLVGAYASLVPGRRLLLHNPPQRIMVCADPLRIEQVMRNLLSNAIKYSSEGDIDVRLCAQGPHAVIEVQDRGIGIPDTEIEQIFLPFRRRSLNAPPGVGLGLSVVRRIVHAHGGTIEVESEEGAGSTFRVRLPLLV
jgi:signal transduction histidine kinase